MAFMHDLVAAFTSMFRQKIETDALQLVGKVSYDGFDIGPSTDRWVRVNFGAINGEPTSSSGTQVTQTLNGIVFVQVFVPNADGSDELLNIVDEIFTQFSQWAHATPSMRTFAPSTSPITVDDAWLTTTVRIPFVAFNTVTLTVS